MAESARQLSVPAELSFLEASIDALEKELAIVYDRLGRVMSPDTPRPQIALSGRDVPKGPLPNAACELAESIQLRRTRIENIVARVANMRDRLEV